MFDIGVNLTSSQFAKDRDDVVARAFDAELMGYSSPVPICVKASRRKAGASVFVLLVNGGRTSSRQQPVASCD